LDAFVPRFFAGAFLVAELEAFIAFARPFFAPVFFAAFFVPVDFAFAAIVRSSLWPLTRDGLLWTFEARSVAMSV
jgi:hypothetical protein